MKRRVTVVGHADADGHLIAEQVRRNLSLVPHLKVDAVVDPKRTQGHRAWLHLDEIPEIDGSDFVFFVDLMFSPADFDDESDALVRYVSARPRTRFFLIDHHPLPLARLRAAKNLRLAYRPDVFECAIGPRSGMMVVAAICERQKEAIGGIRQPHHDVLATGMRRAAAPGGALAGRRLMQLLRSDRWDVIYSLGEDDATYHRLVRGRRPTSSEKSQRLVAAEREAENAYESFVNDKMSLSRRPDTGRKPMPYDAAIERFVRAQPGDARMKNEPAAAKDLEALVTILEVAALSLSDAPDATFTRDQLIREARDIAGDDLEIDERDAKIVLEKATFVKGTARELRLR